MINKAKSHRCGSVLEIPGHTDVGLFYSLHFYNLDLLCYLFIFSFNRLKQNLVLQYKLTHLKQMINTAFCSETFPHYAYNPAIGVYFLAESNAADQEHTGHSHLEKQISELKQQTASLMRMVEELKHQLQQKKKGAKKSKVNKIKKVYTKDRNCPHENCDKRYSSKIALNAHIKKVHEKQPEDSQEYVF